MARFLLSRLASSSVVILVVALIVFGLTTFSGGDPATIYAGDDASPERLAQIREQMGLNRPFYVQFLLWLQQIFSGNLGISLFTGRPVLTLVAQRLEPTVVIALVTIVISVGCAVPLGAMAALRPHGLIDKFLSALSSIAFALPVFIAAYILIYIFSIQLRWFPVQGYTPLAEGPLNTLRSVLLPCISLALIYIGLLARTTRASMVVVLQQDYIRAARARGARTGRLIVRHVLRNVANSIITVIGLGIASMISGFTLVETVFALPGLGRLTVDAVLNRDFPVIQGLILIFAAAKIVINLTIDISYRIVDPRVSV